MNKWISANLRSRKAILVLILAVLVVTASGMATIFAPATAAVAEREILPDATPNNTEYQKLLDLRLDGYEEMSIFEYQNKVWVLMDTAEYRDLLERISKSEGLYEAKDSDETASFVFNILNPLTSERWRTQRFDGAIRANHSEAAAILEYDLTLTILDNTALTVGAYNEARTGIIGDLQAFLYSKTDEELRDNTAMQKAIEDEISTLTQKWESDSLQIALEYSYKAEGVQPNADFNDRDNTNTGAEARRSDYGTKEDYLSLLALRTENDRDMSVADFNAKLLDWANENTARMDRIDEDIIRNDYQVDLSQEELEFVQLTVFLSGTENGKSIQSNYSGELDVDPVYHEYLPQKLAKDENSRLAWCDLYYQFSYHIADSDKMTVGERDRCVGGMVSAIQDFWDATPLDELLGMTESDITAQLASFANEYSSQHITITIIPEKVHFERVDERAIW